MEGRRKGRTPVGEAWLFEGTRACSMPATLRNVCHFRQVGLKEGRPAAASFALLKTYKVGTLQALGARCGNLFGG